MGHTRLASGLTRSHLGYLKICNPIPVQVICTYKKTVLVKKPVLWVPRTPSDSPGPNTPKAAESSFSEREPEDGRSTQHEPPGKGAVPIKLLVLIFLVLLTGVSNRVLYKMALVPLRDHIFFLAQFQNLGYLVVYFTALAWRIRSGQVTKAMLAVDKRPLAAVGACEAVSQLLFMVGASHLPGQLLPVVNQTYLVWSLVFASLILGTRYSRAQLIGAGLVMAGVLVAAVQPSVLLSLLHGGTAAGPGAASAAAAAAASSAGVELRYVAVCVACFAFPAIANCIKERVFRSAAASLGRPLDIFVVNSFGSLAQSAFVLLLLPVTTALKGISLPDLPAHLAVSAKVFMGQVPAAAGAAGEPLGRYAAPLLALSYVAMNLAFNISILTLLRSVGSVTTTLVGSSLVPLTIVAFTLPLPYLEPVSLGPKFVAGASLLMFGLATYNWDSWKALMGRSRGEQTAPGGGGSGLKQNSSAGAGGPATAEGPGPEVQGADEVFGGGFKMKTQ